MKGIASLGTQPFGGISGSSPRDLEPTVERFRQRVSELVDTFIQMLEHRPEQVGQFASQAAGVGWPHSSDDHRSVSVLQPPPPVSSGQAGCLVLSLENDDPG